MQIKTVESVSRPMLHVTRSAPMDSAKISGIMGEAFTTIGDFIARHRIRPAGRPLAIYRDWDGQRMNIDVGFPVVEDDATLETSEVRVGRTPSGKAIMALHRGSYAGLADTYKAMEEHLAETGQKALGTAWEIYLNDPDSTPDAELQTEVYMAVA